MTNGLSNTQLALLVQRQTTQNSSWLGREKADATCLLLQQLSGYQQSRIKVQFRSLALRFCFQKKKNGTKESPRLITHSHQTHRYGYRGKKTKQNNLNSRKLTNRWGGSQTGRRVCPNREKKPSELSISPMLALSEVRKCIGTVSVVEKPQSPPHRLPQQRTESWQKADFLLLNLCVFSIVTMWIYCRF